MKLPPEAGRIDDGAARLMTIATLDEFLDGPEFSETDDVPVWIVLPFSRRHGRSAATAC